MRRVTGWSVAELKSREQVFEALVAKATRQSLRAVNAQLGSIVTAATLSPEPAPRGTFSTAELSVVTAAWQTHVGAELFPFLLETYTGAADAVATAIEAGLDVTVSVMPESYAASYLRNAENRLKGIGDLIWAAVRDALAAGLELGESTVQLAARVRGASGVTEGRANTIARTEVVAAANAGSLGQMQAAGFSDDEVEKEWLATEDERTRIAHHQADGQRVGLNEPFNVGGEGLQFPGDPLGSAGNIINCRCTLGYVFAGDLEEDDDNGGPLTAGIGAVYRWISRLHPRDAYGRFTEKGSPFVVLSKDERGKSGDVQYAPGMYGRYGAAGIMMRHRGSDGVDRFLVVQRSTGKFNKWKWQLPGGAIDELETPEQGAARESYEEIGATDEFLSKLVPRGTHRVELPVEGKKPWAYSNIAADAPYQFKPDIDYNELGAARWLTAEQIREMKGRGRLVAPFAEHLESIFAQFGEPLVSATAAQKAAAKTAGLKSLAKSTLGNGEWDEAEHPRSDKTGKFIKSGTSDPALDLAEKNLAGFKQLLAKAKAKPYPNSAAVKALTQEVKDLEKKIAKAKGKPAPKAAAPVGVGKVPSGGQPLKINTKTIYNTAYSDQQVVAEKPASGFEPMTRIIWKEGQKKFLLQKKWHDDTDWVSATDEKQFTFGKGEAYKKFSKESGWLTPGTLPTAPTAAMFTAPPTPAPTFLDELNAGNWDPSILKQLSDLEFANFVHTQVAPMGGDEYMVQSTDTRVYIWNRALKHDAKYITSLSKVISAVEASASSKTPAAPHAMPKITDTSSWYPGTFEKMSDAMFSMFMAHELPGMSGKDYVSKVSPGVRAAISARAQAYDNKHVTSYTKFLQLMEEEGGKTSVSLPAAAVDLSISNVAMQAMSKDTFTKFLKTLTPENTASLSTYKKHILLDAAEDHGVYNLLVEQTGIGGTPSTIPSPPNLSKPIGDMSPAEFNEFFEKHVDKSMWDSAGSNGKKNLEAAAAVAEMLGFDTPAKQIANWKSMDAAGTAAPPVTPAPPVIMPHAAKVAAEQIHLDTIANMLPATSISLPEKGQKDFKVLGNGEMHAMQKDMLAQAGKSGWSSTDQNAVQRYTTSIGYRSTNAVLRNDVKQLKTLSTHDQQAGSNNAVDLQETMLPLTQNVKLFRGTGAQAFGFPNTNAAFDDLKKLEGSTIVDRGFVSTTFLEKTGVSFDYASKPIRIEISAPKGTPAVFVSNVTPSWSKENELILAAGTNFKIKSVRQATAADKAKYGSGLEQIVQMEVVPAPYVTLPSAPTTPAPSPATSAVPAPPKVSAPNLVPKKINTAVIYKTTYADHAVVAEQPLAGSEPAARLIWSATKKKFFLQLNYTPETTPNAWMNDSDAGYSKSAAYAKFSKEDNWFAPGAIALSTGYDTTGGSAPGDSANAPSVSGKPAAPVVAPKPPPKYTDVDFVKAYYNTNSYTPAQIDTLTKKVKHNETITLSSTPETIFKKLFTVAEEIKNNQTDEDAPPTSMFGLLTLFDAKAAELSKAPGGNQKLYEKKVIDWLKTAQGKTAAGKIVSGWVDPNPPKATPGVATLNVKPATEIGTPKTGLKAADFTTVSNTQMTAIQKEMFAKYGDWTPEQRAAIKAYTGSSYSTMNGVLRGMQKGSPSTVKAIEDMQLGMKPVTKNIILTRKSSTAPFSGYQNASVADIQKLIGSVVQDKGFASSSTTGTWSGNWQLTIEVPEGTPLVWAKPISMHSSEDEVILAAGTKYKILSVTPTGSGYNAAAHIRVRVVP